MKSSHRSIEPALSHLHLLQRREVQRRSGLDKHCAGGLAAAHGRAKAVEEVHVVKAVLVTAQLGCFLLAQQGRRLRRVRGRGDRSLRDCEPGLRCLAFAEKEPRRGKELITGGVNPGVQCV